MLASSPQRTVYRSREPDTNRDVVVKLLTSKGAPNDPLVHDRFLRDIGAMQFLSLSAFPKILDFGFTDDHSAFMVMEWIDGENLTSLADLQPHRVIPILTQVAEALEALAMGVVYHHNLSPDNILVQARPEGEVPKIIGFGTAAYFAQAAAGTIIGHSADVERFIAPERLGTSDDISEAGVLSDLYSLALVTVDVLGGDISNLGSADPEVRFSDDIRATLSNANVLEDALSGALSLAPDQRQTTYAILKNALEWDFVLMEGVGPGSDPDRTSKTLVELPGPPPLPLSATPRPPTVSGGPGDETTMVLESPSPDGPIDEDLIPTGSVSFDPNKTDPLFKPPPPNPPDLPQEQTPEIEAVPPVPEGGGSGLKFDRRLLLWVPVGLAVMAIVALGTVMLWRLSHRPPPKALPVTIVQPTPAPRVPTPVIPAEAEVHPGLSQADLLLLEGNVEGARVILSAITPEEVELFSTEEIEAFDAMKNALEGSQFDTAVSDLKGGLDHGSIPMLKRGVAGVQRSDSEELTGRPGVAVMLKRAQAALRLHALMWEAQEAQDYPLVMERASTMIEALPKYSTAFKFRDQAASALEDQSDRARETGNFRRAKDLLEPVNTYWPERPGLAQRLSAVNEAEQQLEIQRAQIVRALAMGQEGDPESGLGLLGSIKPVNMLQASYSEALALLQQHLAELDAQPPSVTLKPQTELTFKKKKTVTIRLTVTDDRQVTEVAAYLKTAGATGYSKIDLSLDTSTDSCTFEVGPETHKNEDFLLYVEALDGSGHTGRLASPEAPLEFKRKKGLKALFSK